MIWLKQDLTRVRALTHVFFSKFSKMPCNKFNRLTHKHNLSLHNLMIMYP